MKRMMMVILALLLCACQPTPDTEFIQNKANGKLMETVEQEAVLPYAPQDGDAEAAQSARTLKQALGVPDRVTDTLSGSVYGGSMQVEIDADVLVPDVTRVPVYEARIRQFSKEQAKQSARIFLGEGPYRNFNDMQAMRDGYTVDIQHTVRMIEAYQSRCYGDGCTEYGDLIDRANNAMQKQQEILESLPQPEPSEPWTGSFSDANWTVANGNNDMLFYQYGVLSFESDLTNPAFRTTVSEAQMAETATALLKALGNAAEPRLTELQPSDQFDRETYHSSTGIEDGHLSLYYLPYYAGIPCFDFNTNNGSDTAKTAAGIERSAAPAYKQERIAVGWQDDAVRSVSWTSPMEIIDTANENVALLPFDTILKTFQKQVFYNYFLDTPADGTEATFRMVIREIRFSYMRVQKPDSDTFLLVPVWDFLGYGVNPVFGDTEMMRRWYQGQSFLTINAIDGSIIDRNCGY